MGNTTLVEMVGVARSIYLRDNIRACSSVDGEGYGDGVIGRR